MTTDTSRPARALWIEISPSNAHWSSFTGSRPARALWIEIGGGSKNRVIEIVEAREGLVD